MLADNGSNGGLKRDIRLLEIEVADGRVSWRDYRRWPSADYLSGHGDLARTPERSSALSLLVKLLRHHSDLDRKEDRISNELYGVLLRVVGQQLFALLFVGDLKVQVADAIDRVREGKILLRVRLSFTGADRDSLAELPWEYVHTPPGDGLFDDPGVFLSKRAELMLSRLLPSRRRRDLGDRKPLSVLLVSPNPIVRGDSAGDENNLARVDARSVAETLKELQDEHMIRLSQLVDDPAGAPVEYPNWVTTQVFKQRIRQLEPGPVIVHFIGHGRHYKGRGQLLFSRSDGSAHWVDALDFTDDVERNSVKLVFLQACHSALPHPYIPFSSVAMALAGSGLPGVVAMQYRIKAELANEFTKGFYDELLRHNSPIDVAVEAGRERIDNRMDDRDRLAFGLPVVYLTSHDRMLIDDRGAASEDLEGKGNELSLVPCPRCQIGLRPDASVCRRCRLRLTCAVCPDHRVFLDPINDNLCECGAEVHQPDWKSDTPPTAPPVAAPSSEAVLSVLDGTPGDPA